LSFPLLALARAAYTVLYSVRNCHGKLDFCDKFTKNRLSSFVQSKGKKFHKFMGIFIIDGMVILPQVKKIP
jgi:hypothetical protein